MNNAISSAIIDETLDGEDSNHNHLISEEEMIFFHPSHHHMQVLESEYIRRMRMEEDEGFLKSRIFALFLIAVASLYVFIMIWQAWSTNRLEFHQESYSSEYEYTYATQSYDYRQYQSGTLSDGKRGFDYNQSIRDGNSDQNKDLIQQISQFSIGSQNSENNTPTQSFVFNDQGQKYTNQKVKLTNHIVSPFSVSKHNIIQTNSVEIKRLDMNLGSSNDNKNNSYREKNKAHPDVKNNKHIQPQNNKMRYPPHSINKIMKPQKNFSQKHILQKQKSSLDILDDEFRQNGDNQLIGTEVDLENSRAKSQNSVRNKY